jgi:hypothetical protein
VFTGADARGRPTQMSRTVRSGKRDAQKLAAQLETSPSSLTRPKSATLEIYSNA